MADLASLNAVIKGRVQGVFFRAFVARKAKELDITGYTRNLPGGAVEVNAEGERQQLEKLIGFLKTGPPAAEVEEVIVNWSEYAGTYPRFSITYGEP